MLQDDDLKAFLNAFAKSNDPSLAPASPRDVLASSEGLLTPEVWRLGCSLQTAAGSRKASGAPLHDIK
jgi:hypothetical protein